METAPIETPIAFRDFADVQAGIVKWPMSVIRLRGSDPARIAQLADKILTCWRGYSDESVSVIAYSDGQPHNTITPIARRRGEEYELDLVLRCNITTQEHPLGVFHPHADKHHIKKENIGLIEVMGLAVLPSRLKQELTDLAAAIVEGKDISADEALQKHGQWVEQLRKRHGFTAENALDIILQETGKVFAAVLEDAGVYKNTRSISSSRAMSNVIWVVQMIFSFFSSTNSSLANSRSEKMLSSTKKKILCLQVLISAMISATSLWM